MDVQRTLELRPWTFDRNLLTLEPLVGSVLPGSVNLDWSPFFVHVHGLPPGLRTLEVIRSLGHRLGKWLVQDQIESEVQWRETVRIRININTLLPLSRAITLRSDEDDAVIVRFTYERLPNFCYMRCSVFKF
ncbi:hypothetical protein Salat_2470800 [Sesamum alatum]|uniref:Uncharacterized protein n=1 Tax=Sesamum alatum TaxID=300844 RepID=A0AAE1XR40_9LAMI|nr:hypothetical protein Salat_2470800 [Sesamum alatum]